MPLSREEVQHIALLARVGLNEEDIARFREQLSEIVDYFQRLREVNTDDVPPTAHTLPLHSVLRSDEPQPSFAKEEILANAPRRQDDLFQVQAILEE